MLISSTSTFLLAATAVPQVGGEVAQIYQFDGGHANGNLGNSLALLGDLNDDGHSEFLIGEKFASPNGLTWAGTATVYSGIDGSVLYQYHGSNERDSVGFETAAVGDVNADGVPDFALGIPSLDNGSVTDAGAVHVYSGADGTQLFNFSAVRPDGHFGSSVSAAGDTNADGYDDIIVGSRLHGIGGALTLGTARIYSGFDGTILFNEFGPDNLSYFGCDVDGVGDINHDGHDDFVVGAYGVKDSLWYQAGKAFVYSGADHSLLHEFVGDFRDERLGFSVAGGGDIDGDGTPDIIVGAPGAMSSHHGNDGEGVAFVYSGATGLLIYDLPGKTPGGIHGRSVASAGDADHDGWNDILVGAPLEENWVNIGAVYLYSGFDGSVLLHQKGSVDSWAGYSVSGGQDVNGDGILDLAYGAPWANFKSGQATVLSLLPYLSLSQNQISVNHGASIDLYLNFPQAAAGQEYKVLISSSGTGPTHHGIDIPLTQDGLVVDTYLGNYPLPGHSGMHGVLDANGQANANMPIPAGLPGSFIGSQFWVAAISNPAGSLPEYTSIARPVVVTL